MDIEKQYDKIYRFCYYRLKNREAAEDITQETFLRWFASDTYRNKNQALQYLYTIARNLCIDEYRRRKPAMFAGDAQLPANCVNLSAEGLRLSSGDAYPSAGNVYQSAGGANLPVGFPPALAGDPADSIALRHALEKLSDQDRELVLLRYVNQEPVGFLCRQYGLSRFALYRRLKNILKRLRDDLTE